ncbi:pilin [Gilvimarinus sp. F26214L]|uniref:pilin n=1 Tax=Gilvimarinus sp. DZF01 TaxID=3461371 RepID=UPI0040459FD3
MGEIGALRTAAELCFNEGDDETQCNWGFSGSSLLGGSNLVAINDQSDTPIPGFTAFINAAATAGSNTIEMNAAFGNGASGVIQEKYLKWSRDFYGAWTCTTNVDANYAPTGCDVSST